MPKKTKTPGQKRAETNLKNNPNYYRDMAKKRKKPFLHFSWLKQSDPERLRRISKDGGQVKKYDVIRPGTLDH